MQLLQDRPARLDVVLRTDDAARLHPLRDGLRPLDVTCQVKRAGDTAWAPTPLGAGTWLEVGHGAYLLELAALDLERAGSLLVLVSGALGLVPAIHPVLLQVEVVPARELRGARPDLPQTIVIGQLAGQDGRPLARATVSATLLETPLLLRGTAIAGDAVIASSDDDGFFALPLITGATVDLSIPAARYRRTLVIPPPLAPGVPLRLFSIP